MTDISREAVERRATAIYLATEASVAEDVASILRALRDALDAAEKERDELHALCTSLEARGDHAMERLNAAESALAAEREKNAWQPIESAPRDGRQVILYGHWRQFHGTKHELNHVNSGHYANGWVCEGRYEEYFIASKWRPLPPPPKEPTP